jgi:hypothetical protein
MDNLFPLLNSSSAAKLGCYASLPGTGPSGEICARCSLLEPLKSKFVCGKYKSLTGRQGRPISPNSAACKYFVARPAFNSPRTPS